MTEAVIVATARSPIGRANKGSLTSIRPDDLTAQIIDALLAKVPGLDPALVEDLILGCGQPAGESGFNIARVVAILAGLDDVPGVTVNRYCSSSLQTIRMAAHAIKAGEGDIFIAAGVETVSRYGAGFSDSAPNDVFKEAGLRTLERSGGGQPEWTPPEGLPDIYIAMGQTAENVVEAEHVSPRRDGRVRQAVAGSRGRQRRERLLRRGDHPGDAARRHDRRQGRRPACGRDARRSRRARSRCSVPTVRSPRATPAR